MSAKDYQEVVWWVVNLFLLHQIGTIIVGVTIVLIRAFKK